MRRAWLGLAAVLAGWAGGCAADRAAPVARAISVEARLEGDVRALSEGFATRNGTDRATLNAAGVWVMERLGAMGYAVRREEVPVGERALGAGVHGFNVVAEIPGATRPGEIVVVGAHYDAEVGTPGADDNASGVAVMLELARRFAGSEPGRTLRFVAFTNEEGSNSRGSLMGSRLAAEASRERGEAVVAMLSLEMLGYFRDEPGSQTYPFPTDSPLARGMNLPDQGDFVAVLGRLADGELVERLGSAMAGAGSIPVAPVALPPVVRDMWRSDNGNYWVAGYPAVMVTDTSNFRNPHYHRATDTAETLDFARMAGVVEALEAGVRALLGM